MSSVEKKQKELTRRDFVKGAAAGAVGGLVVGATRTALPAPEAQPEPWLPAKWDYQTDMLIIGAGSAGQMATIEAHDKGAKVLLVEMASSPLFAESACNGSIAAVPRNPWQIEEGILDDSPDLLYEDIRRVGKYSNRLDLLRLFVDRELEAYNRFWALGAKPIGNTIMGGHSRKRAIPHINRQCQEALYNQIKKRGISTLFNTRVTRLVADPTTRRVLGVEAMEGVNPPDYKGGKRIFVKGKVTVLATGGMCGNPEMLKRYVPRVKALAAWAEPGAPGLLKIPEGPARPIGLGDGYKMAMSIGADTTHMYCITMYTGTPVGPEAPEYGRSYQPTFMTTEEDTRYNAIAVNKEGKRFSNEYMALSEVGEAMVLQTDKTCFPIADKTIYEAALRNPFFSRYTPAMLQLIKEGKFPFWSGDTLEELATKAGINPAGLKETVVNWNRYVDQGVDPEFGRPLKAPSKTYKIVTPPFYAIQYWIAPMHNGGGLRANTRLQILDVYGNVIPGLYGAGEIIGGTSGEVYLSSTHWPVAVTFGYLVGKEFAIGEALAT
jgi:fumarate reductase flavoprotein subunit